MEVLVLATALLLNIYGGWIIGKNALRKQWSYSTLFMTALVYAICCTILVSRIGDWAVGK